MGLDDLAKEGIINVHVDVNWEEYAKLYRRLTGEADKRAKELLLQMDIILWEYNFLTSKEGYMITDANGDIISIFGSSRGVRPRLIMAEDARALSEGLGEGYSYCHVLSK